MRLRALVSLALLVSASAACKVSPGGGCFDEGSARCDGPLMLVCKSHRWEPVSCAGPKGCSQSYRFIDCDETVASIGMPCSVEPGGYSGCSTDHKTRLKCDAGIWREDITCRGPKGCVVSARFVDCDDSVAMVGDACEPDGLACSLDLRSVLACRSGAYAVDEICASGRCSVKGNNVGCD